MIPSVRLRRRGRADDTQIIATGKSAFSDIAYIRGDKHVEKVTAMREE